MAHGARVQLRAALIRREESRLMLNGFPETNEILSHLQGEFTLVFNYRKLNLSLLTSRGPALQRLESFVLHDIELKGQGMGVGFAELTQRAHGWSSWSWAWIVKRWLKWH